MPVVATQYQNDLRVFSALEQRHWPPTKLVFKLARSMLLVSWGPYRLLQLQVGWGRAISEGFFLGLKYGHHTHNQLDSMRDLSVSIPSE